MSRSGRGADGSGTSPQRGASQSLGSSPGPGSSPGSPSGSGPTPRGRELELTVGPVAHGGVFVARHEGRVVFVPDALEGERVRVRISDDRHDSFWRAETVEVLDASPHRRPHVWTAASLERAPGQRAGGAEFGHIELSEQRRLKAQVLTEALDRMAGVQREVIVEPVPLGYASAESPDVVVDDGLGWRTRVRLQVDGQGRIGPYAARSHDVVDVDDLPLADPRIRAVAPLRERRPGAAHIDLVAAGDAEAVVVTTHRDRSRGRSDGDRGDRGDRGGRGGRSGGGGWGGNRGRGSGGRRRPEPAVVRERVGDRELLVDRAGFWQVHSGAPATLVEAVLGAIDFSRLDQDAANLDLYGGVGLFARVFADRFGDAARITSVESDARATGYAARNLAEADGADAVTAPVADFLHERLASASARDRARQAASTVILDPPRAGAGRAVVDALAAWAPRQLVYVACDPVALARDVGLFRERGYELSSLRAFDMFPHTHHVESVALLSAIVDA